MIRNLLVVCFGCLTCCFGLCNIALCCFLLFVFWGGFV